MTITAFQSDLPAGLQRSLALGVYKAAVIAEIRQRGLPAAIEYAQTRGGVGPRCIGLARQMVRLVERVGDVPARVIEASSYPVKPCTMVLIPNLTWTHKGRRQIAKLEWVPVHTFPARVEGNEIQP